MDKNQQRPKRQPQLPAKYVQEASGEAEPPRKIQKKQPVAKKQHVAKEQQKTPSREDMLLLLQSNMESSDPQVNVQFPPNPLIQNRAAFNNPKPSSAAARNFSTPLPIPIPTPTLQAPPPQQDSMTTLLHLVQQLGQRIDVGLQQLEQKMNMGLQQLEKKVDQQRNNWENRSTVVTLRTWSNIRGTRSLYYTRMMRAIHETTIRSTWYAKPTTTDFAAAGKAALEAGAAAGTRALQS